MNEQLKPILKRSFDLPDGWTCSDCGKEYLKDFEGTLIGSYEEGTLCKKCFKEWVEAEE